MKYNPPVPQNRSEHYCHPSLFLDPLKAVIIPVIGMFGSTFTKKLVISLMRSFGIIVRIIVITIIQQKKYKNMVSIF
ncbi:MAG: hypothetical protein CMP48_06295 [Rickettsiales bacterium]|nr:hypothetical protein [Rickettsiales bacterium]